MAQQLYSTADSIVVGNYVGDGALAAVGASNPILNLLLVLFMGISVGATVMVSQYFGAKDRDKLSATVGTTITATFVASVFIMIVGPLVTRPIMSAAGHPRGHLRGRLHLPGHHLRRASSAAATTTSSPACCAGWEIPSCR